MEGESITLEIRLLDDITQPLTLTVRTEDVSSAVSASDYVELNQTLTFLPGGDTSLTVIVQALPDDLAEPVETFQVVLSQPSLRIEESATIYIIDTNGMRKKLHLHNDKSNNKGVGCILREDLPIIVSNNHPLSAPLRIVHPLHPFLSLLNPSLAFI